ncbi:MAG: hypothetical protein ILP14_06600, partial [Oscillospiraceae bacterium]|nr:hypothetical protein [Oscillospiraceae bacterium]
MNLFGLKLDARNKEDRIILNVVNNLFSVALISLMTALIGAILDGLIISNFLGETAFAAFNLSSPLTNLIELAGSVVATGCVVTCGRLIGAGNAKDANQRFTSCFTLCVIAGGGFAVLLFFIPQATGFLVGKKGAEFGSVMFEYVRGMAFGIPAMMLTALLNGVVQLDGGKKRVLAGAYVICGVNLTGDLMVVTLTDWGLLGVGAVTTFSYICGVVVLFRHFHGKNTIFRPGISFSGLKNTLPNGLPAVYNRAATILRNYCYNALALQWGGAAGIVAWSTVNNLSAFLSSLPKAFGQATLMGSGVFYGEEDKDSLQRFMRYILALRGLITLAVVIIVLILSPLLVRLYIPVSSEAYLSAVSGLRWYTLGLVPYTINIIIANYMQSAKKSFVTQIISFMDGFGMLVLYALFLLNIMGFYGLCVSFFLGKGTVLLLTLLWIGLSGKPSIPTVEKMLMLPGDFDVPDEDKYLATLTSREEAINISEGIVSYCVNKGIDMRRSYHVGLALEEMSVIIINEGFNDGKKHSIDIKLFVKNGRINVRLRDDCKTFDVNKRIEIMNPEDKASNPGIRILNSIAKDVDYYSA